MNDKHKKDAKLPSNVQFPTVQARESTDGKTIRHSDLQDGVTLWVPSFHVPGARKVMFMFTHDGGPTVIVPMEKGRDIEGYIRSDHLSHFRPGDRVLAWGMVLSDYWQTLPGTSYELL